MMTQILTYYFSKMRKYSTLEAIIGIDPMNQTDNL